MAAVTFTRLLPAPAGEVDPETLLESLALGGRAPAGRPRIAANFVSSADGRGAFGGRSAALGDDGDRAMFHALRERVDAVLAGPATLSAERYGRILARPERRERRAAAGRAPEPLACTVTRSGRVPTDIPLFAEPEARVVIFSCAQPDLSGVRAHVEVVVLDRDSPNPLADAMAILRERFSIRSLLCEGGPTLFGALLHAGLVDELFLTLAPKLAGGDSGPAISVGPPLAALAALRLEWLLQREDSLYLRYALAGGAGRNESDL
jgi:riboflavin biosynthesis pyrimidine reductase